VPTTLCAGRNVPADGGNGGKGGDVIIRADARVRSLRNVENVQNAPAGRAGGGQRQRGADGADLVVLVPCGTVVLAHRGARPCRLRFALHTITCSSLPAAAGT
jgi:GTPase involved in cell partitioning and DNA repair